MHRMVAIATHDDIIVHIYTSFSQYVTLERSWCVLQTLINAINLL